MRWEAQSDPLVLKIMSALYFFLRSTTVRHTTAQGGRLYTCGPYLHVSSAVGDVEGREFHGLVLDVLIRARLHQQLHEATHTDINHTELDNHAEVQVT